MSREVVVVAPPIPDGLDATLVLLRHGESTWVAEGRFQGRADVPLSAIGRRQAELAAGRLAAPHASPALPVPFGLPVEVVHSPIRRAAETAEAVGDALARAVSDARAGDAPPLRADDGFAEIAQGDWEGLTSVEIRSRWNETLATWRRRPLEAWAPGGEPLPDVQRRVVPALRGLLETLAARGGSAPHAPGSLTVPPVERDQVLGYAERGAAAELAANQPWSILVAHDGVFKIALLTLFGISLEHFWAFSFALCGISVVELRGGRATLRAHNLAEHLAPMLDERAIAVSEARERSGAL